MQDSNQDAIPEIQPATDDLNWQDPKTDELSSEYVGRWIGLVSTTNWEKGRIIQQWRHTLIDSSATAPTYSDEAWSRRVGGVTPQHVGRLRRVHERFGDSHQSYPSLYWSHFFAALDWDDAEMWLEGAVQSRWSVSKMRLNRWEAMGGDPKQQPQETDLRTATEDEDFAPLSEVNTGVGIEDAPRGTFETGPRYDDPDFGDADASGLDDSAGGGSSAPAIDDLAPWEDAPDSSAAEQSPFAQLPSLPTDIEEALELFKLAIVRHRASQWSEVSRESVILALEALKAFTQR